MIPEGLKEAITNRKALHGLSNIPESAFPDWNDLVPYFDKSFLNGNKRARDPHKIFCDVLPQDFPIVRKTMDTIGTLINSVDISSRRYSGRVSCHCYAGFSPNAKASPPHCDPMHVLFFMIQGSMPWKIFEDGCDYNDETQAMTSKSTFSRRLVQGDFVYVPKGVYHCAIPDSSRVGFSFGWT